MTSRTTLSVHRGTVLAVTVEGPCEHGEEDVCLDWPCAPGTGHRGRHGEWGQCSSDIPARWRGLWAFSLLAPFAVLIAWAGRALVLAAMQ